MNNFERGSFKNNNILNINKWKSKKEFYKLKMKLYNMILMSDDRLKHNNITFIDYVIPKKKQHMIFVMS